MRKIWVKCTYCGLKELRPYFGEWNKCKHCNQEVENTDEEVDTSVYGYEDDSTNPYARHKDD